MNEKIESHYMDAGITIINVKALVDYLLAMKYDEHCNGRDDYVDNLVIGLKHVRRMLERHVESHFGLTPRRRS